MFISDLSIERYEAFIAELNQEHFLRSVRWAEFRRHINWEYKIVGFEENSELTIAAIIMFKNAGKLPFKVAYSSRGYICREGADESGFTEALKKYLKKQKAFVYKIDPDQLYANLDRQLNRIGEPNQKRVDELIALGYKHLGFVNNFEGMQPRHTIRIDTNGSYEDALKRMDPKVRNKTKAGLKTGLVIEKSDFSKLPEFMKIFQETAERDHFQIRDISYFQKMHEAFGDDLRLCLAKVDFAAAIEKQTAELEKVRSELNKMEEELLDPSNGEKYRKKINNRIAEFSAKISKNERVISEFKEALAEHPDGMYIAGVLYIIEGKRAWYIYGATSDNYRYMLPSYALVSHMVSESTEEGFEYLDMFGIGGDFDPDNHVFGLYSFKKGFGGQPIEFIGEFDLPINRPLFYAFDYLFPKLKSLRKRK